MKIQPIKPKLPENINKAIKIAKPKPTGERIVSRELPNCIGAEDECYGIVECGYSEFYPEDLAKMEGMNVRERLAFKEKLLLAGRYIEKRYN